MKFIFLGGNSGEYAICIIGLEGMDAPVCISVWVHVYTCAWTRSPFVHFLDTLIAERDVVAHSLRRENHYSGRDFR